MLIKDVHPDIQRYLENDCYCQYEVYDLSGFFYQIVKPDEECVFLGENNKFTLVAWQDQLLVVIKRKKPESVDETQTNVVNMQRVDATENNIKELKMLVNDPTYKVKVIDEHVAGATKKAFEEILSISDAVMISR